MRTMVTVLFVGLIVWSGQDIIHAQPAPAASVTVDVNTIARFSPRARADIINAIINRWSAVSKADITTPLRIQHFMAQIATETGGMRLLEENMNYSAQRLLEVFPNRVTAEQAQQLANKPVAIANHVYNGRLGNQPPMDGWTYRGSGLIQLTGRANFAARGLEIHQPLEDQPDIVRSPLFALDSAVAYWSARGINAAADQNDIAKVRLLVNGGDRGLPEARIWLARARVIFAADSGPNASAAFNPEETAAIRDRLSSLNFLVRKPNESLEAGQVSEALRRFQESRGLAATGRYDDDTLYELTNPDNFKPDQN